MLWRFALSLPLIVLLCAALPAGPTTKPTSNPVDENGLPMPLTLAQEQQKAGQPLAQYVELLKRERDYDASKMWRDVYWDIRGTRASFLGDQLDAQACFDRVERAHNNKEVESSPIDNMKPTDAAQYILSVADQHQVIMLSERHHVPQTRIVSIQLLQGLWDKGFRYLALETLDNRPDTMDKTINQRTYPTMQTGFYTQEPVFGELVRQARKIGFTVVAYEANEALSVPHDPENPNKRQNAREREEAENIKKNILDVDPKAKIFVHCGMGHASKHKGHDDTGGKGEPWVAMARWFWDITGIEPFTIDEQSNLYERTRRDLEMGIYRYAIDKSVVDGPTVFVGDDGEPFTLLPESYDVSVFLPRVKYESGRPDWMAGELTRTPTKIPPELLKGEGIRLVQAIYANEPDDAVPADQIVVRPGQDVPVLMLPKGSFKLRTWDETGKVVATGKIDV